MLPAIVSPKISKFKNVMWFVGLDPAVKVDFFGIVIHGLFPKPEEGEWNPFIRELFEIKHDNFTEIISWINTTLFRAYPIRYGIIDATRDTPTSQEMERKYGDQTIKALSMTNTLNYELKQTAYSFLEQGYAFPNTILMKNKAKAIAISELKIQTLHERVEWTADNRPRFTHPVGKHNDLNRAWEMSLKAVRDFQMGKVGTTNNDIYRNYPTEEITNDDNSELGGGSSFAMPY